MKRMRKSPGMSFISLMMLSLIHILAVMSVVMAPIVEEPLFRGLLFGCIRPRSRASAYIVSALLFSLYHVWQFVFISGDFGLLIYCLLYRCV